MDVQSVDLIWWWWYSEELTIGGTILASFRDALIPGNVSYIVEYPN